MVTIVRKLFDMQNFHWQIRRISALNSAEYQLLYPYIWDKLLNLGFCVLCFCRFLRNGKILFAYFFFVWKYSSNACFLNSKICFTLL